MDREKSRSRINGSSPGPQAPASLQGCTRFRRTPTKRSPVPAGESRIAVRLAYAPKFVLYQGLASALRLLLVGQPAAPPAHISSGRAVEATHSSLIELPCEPA